MHTIHIHVQQSIRLINGRLFLNEDEIYLLFPVLSWRLYVLCVFLDFSTYIFPINADSPYSTARLLLRMPNRQHNKGSGTITMSLTAVTSFVSVIRERTVFVLRLNIKGCQRVAVPIAIIVSSLLAVGLIVAAGATDQMVKVQQLYEHWDEEYWGSVIPRKCSIEINGS